MSVIVLFKGLTYPSDIYNIGEYSGKKLLNN